MKHTHPLNAKERSKRRSSYRWREEAKLFPELCENPWRSRLLQSQERGAESSDARLTTLEICAGGGGQAIGLEAAGIDHVALVEINKAACDTLRLNRPAWNVIQEDLNEFDCSKYRGVDLVSGGLPCPPFSIAGKQLGKEDERNLFPALIRLVNQTHPRAIMIENVRGILEAVFEDYRYHIASELKKLGYDTGWKLLNTSDFGVPQLRPRVVFVALKKEFSEYFSWPQPSGESVGTVGETLYDLMAARGWKGAIKWREQANEIAPTIVGGSHKHGGPDLGPTRARRAWLSLGVDGSGIANEPPSADFVGIPKLTVPMVARIQGFPDDWHFVGGKTAAYRQVGNAFPPPVAKAVAESIKICLSAKLALSVAK
jgi:DNA (cytosine-5)-methyltransferase 1